MTRATVVSGANFPNRVELSNGLSVTFDVPGDEPGAGPTSTQGVSASLAACTAGTLRLYADRKGWDLDGLKVEVETTYEGPNPKLFQVTVGLPEGLDDDQRIRLMRVAGKCPVHRLLAEAIEVVVEEV